MGTSNSSDKSKLSVCALGCAFGFTLGLGMFILALLSLWMNMGIPVVEAFASVYIGFDASIMGSLIGFAWGFLDGFCGGAIVALIYNGCLNCCPCPFCKSSSKSEDKKEG
jgi:hypothetical protein